MIQEIWLYARVSTEDQVTTDEQVSQMQEHFSRQPMIKIKGIVVEKASAKEIENETDLWNYLRARPEFFKLIRKITTGEGDGIAVWKWDRFARDNIMQELIIRELAKVDKLAMATHDSNERLSRKVIGLMNTEENRKKIDQTKLGMLRIVKQGRPIKGYPTGYKPKYKVIDGKKKMWSYNIDPAKKSVIKHIYRLYRAGRNYKDIERETGVSDKTVKNILKNPTYAGLQVYSGKVYRGNWQPLIPLEEWKQVNPEFNANIENSLSSELA